MKTFADLPIFAGRESFRNDSAGRRRAFRAWVEAFGSTCPNCGRRMEDHDNPALRLSSRLQITLDHIQARSNGGNDAPENLRCVCRGCNERKGQHENGQRTGADLGKPGFHYRIRDRKTGAELWSSFATSEADGSRAAIRQAAEVGAGAVVEQLIGGAWVPWGDRP